MGHFLSRDIEPVTLIDTSISIFDEYDIRKIFTRSTNRRDIGDGYGFALCDADGAAKRDFNDLSAT
jgi:hypothetical protein